MKKLIILLICLLSFQIQAQQQQRLGVAVGLAGVSAGTFLIFQADKLKTAYYDQKTNSYKEDWAIRDIAKYGGAVLVISSSLLVINNLIVLKTDKYKLQTGISSLTLTINLNTSRKKHNDFI